MKTTGSFYCSYRFLLGIIGFVGYAFQYMQKIDMGIGVVCMVNHTALGLLDKHKNDNFTHIILHGNQTTLAEQNGCEIRSFKSNHMDGSLVITKKNQGLILSAYFYGYISAQIIAGVLAAKFGSKIMLFIGMFFGSLMTLLVPVAANTHHVALFVVRLLNGVANAFFMPGMSSLWVYWAPADERSRLIGMSHAGGMVGNIFALLIGGYLCVYGFAGGWPSIFYIFGIVGMLWTIIMFFTFSNTPAVNRWVNETERNYITAHTHSGSHRTLAIPWKSIFLSKACWAIFISHLCNNWGVYLYITQIPSFMKEVLKFDIKSNGMLSSLPFLFCWIFISLSSIAGDKLIRSKRLSRQNVRKIFNGIGLSVPVATLIGISFVNCSTPYLGVALLVIGFAFMGFSLGAGYYVNINDVAGPFSGVVFGISNTFGSIPGLICPYITAVLTTHQTQKEWQIVFLISAVVYLVGFLVYTVLGDAELEHWAQIKKKDQEEEEKGDDIMIF